jgi:hypothetical protein
MYEGGTDKILQVAIVEKELPFQSEIIFRAAVLVEVAEKRPEYTRSLIVQLPFGNELNNLIKYGKETFNHTCHP